MLTVGALFVLVKVGNVARGHTARPPDSTRPGPGARACTIASR
jgi:hypothetical protein